MRALAWRDEVPAGDDAALAEAALAHRLEGYADLAIAGGRWSPPDAVARRVHDARGRAALHGALLRRELAAVAPVLEAVGGTPAIVVKGPALAERAHGDRTLRPYDDVDAVVPRARLRDAAAALVERGWAWSEKPGAVAPGEPLPGWAEAYGHELHVRRAVGAHMIDLELHWRVSDDAAAARLDHAALASRAVRLAALPGVLVPGPEDELLLVAIHLLHHRVARLMWALDVVLARDALDDAAFAGAFARARELGLSWALHAGLDRAEALLGRPRVRPEPAPRRAPLGALRAAQVLPGRAGEHAGRLAGLSWRERGRYARDVTAATWKRATSR
jgi:hypothetical protein